MTTSTPVTRRTERGNIAHSWMVVLAIIAGVVAVGVFALTLDIIIPTIVIVAALPVIGFFHVLSKPDV